MVAMFLTSHLTDNGVNVVGELFRTIVFDPHIDEVSDVVILQSPGLKTECFQQIVRQAVDYIQAW